MKRRIAPLLALLCLLVSLTGCDLFSIPPSGGASSVPDGSTLAVHFIDVGQADSALLVCGEDTMLIDGGNVADSSLMVSYLDRQGIGQLDYVVCTHAHEDHVGGLSGPLNTCTAGHVLSPVTEYDSKAFEDFVKYTEAQGLEPEIPAPGDTFALGEAQVVILVFACVFATASAIGPLFASTNSGVFSNSVEAWCQVGFVATGIS